VRIEVNETELQRLSTELLVVSAFEDAQALPTAAAVVDAALGGQVRNLFDWGDFAGKLNDTAILYTHGALPAKRVLLIGLGKKEEFDLERARQAQATAARRAQALGVTAYATTLFGLGGTESETVREAQALAESVVLSQYQFRQHRTEKDERATPREVQQVDVVVSAQQRGLVEQGIDIGQKIAAAVMWVRDLVNQPANYATPAILAEESLRMAESVGLSCQVLGPAQMRSLEMGALLGVAQGSVQEPRFLVLEHSPTDASSPPVVLIGKGITFDSGGISLKPAENMDKMKDDMAGAAAVLGAMRAIAELQLPQRVVGLVPATENLPGGNAYKPGDVLKTMSGKTIEVISTDAEGRLVLADALTYAQRFRPTAIIDLATLTGACVVALGEVAAGLFCDNDPLAARIELASEVTAEKVWRMPLWKEYAELIKSDVADMKNSGGRAAGAITAAMLLKNFAGQAPWAHLDIAGVSYSDKDSPYRPKGATGYGTRLLVQVLRDWRRVSTGKGA